MFTQCPHCHAIFRVGAATLSEAGGRVQCGACEQTFNAVDALRDELPGPPAHWENTELPFTAPESDADVPVERATQGEKDIPRESRPSTSTPPPPSAWGRPGRRHDRLWLAASAALLLTLVAQLVFAGPRAMADHATLRPVARALCSLSGCTLPPRSDLEQLRLASRDVRAHPSVPGALIISATLVNGASFTQPYPVLEISLGNLQGRQVAIRRFEPGTYLPDRVDVGEGMAPDSRVQVSLEVVDPGETAVAFQFAFRPSRAE